jgi:hypothetical protein
MDQRLRCSWWSPLAALLSLLTLQVVAVSRADASCGDWLAHSGTAVNMDVDDHAPGANSGSQPMKMGSGNSRRLPGSAPCSGPFCRHAPQQPDPSVPASVSFQTDKTALTYFAGARLAEHLQFFRQGESDPHPARGFPTRIDHPPRA